MGLSNNLLPVLQRNVPAMTMCSICPAPGKCCRGFHLSFNWLGYPLLTWEEDANRELREYSLEALPFVVIGAFLRHEGNLDHVHPMYGCPWLEAGQCSNYEHRPSVCHSFVPGQGGGLCVFDPQHKAIPL